MGDPHSPEESARLLNVSGALPVSVALPVSSELHGADEGTSFPNPLYGLASEEARATPPMLSSEEHGIAERWAKGNPAYSV